MRTIVIGIFSLGLATMAHANPPVDATVAPFADDKGKKRVTECHAPLPPKPAELTAPGPHGDLAGTYIEPAMSSAGAKPIVLIIPGSGPTDRDGNNPQGVAAAPYRLLAEGLTKKGIGSLRIDKRGMFSSAGAIPDANDVTIDAYASDIRAWVQALKAKSPDSCIWLAGHSEGGLVALAAANQNIDGVCGLILLASPGRPLGVILREQLKANPANAPILPQALGAIDKLEKGERVDVTGFHPALMSLFAPQVQGFLINAMAHDPAQLAGKVDLPILILQGDADLQVSEADAQALVAAQSNAKLVVLENVTHVLKQVDAEGQAANLATYSNPTLPLAPGIVPAITGFLLTDKGVD